MRRKRGERERLRSVGRSFDRRRRRARVEYEMRLCATSLLKSTAPTDGMYLKGKTRCDVARANEDDGAADSRAREVSAAYSALVRAKIFQEQTHTSEAGRRTTEGGRRERGRVWDYWHFKYGCVPGHSSNSWVSRGLERFRVLASGRVCGRARGKRSSSKPLLTQEL